MNNISDFIEIWGVNELTMLTNKNIGYCTDNREHLILERGKY